MPQACVARRGMDLHMIRGRPQSTTGSNMRRGSINSTTSSGRGSSIASPVRTTADRDPFASSRNTPNAQDDDVWHTTHTQQNASANANCQSGSPTKASEDGWNDDPTSSSPTGTWQRLQTPDESAHVDASDRTDAVSEADSDEDWITDAPESSATTPQATQRHEVEVEAVSSTTMPNARQKQQTAERSNLAPPTNLQQDRSGQQSDTNTASSADSRGASETAATDSGATAAASATASRGAAAASSIQRIAVQNVRWRPPKTQTDQQTVQNAFATAATAQSEGGGSTYARRSSRATGSRATAESAAVQVLSSKNLRKELLKISAANRRDNDPHANQWKVFPTTEMTAINEAMMHRMGAAVLDIEYYAIKPVEDVLEPPSAICFEEDERLEVVVVDVRGPNELLVRHADQAENFREMEQAMKHLYRSAWKGAYGPPVLCPIENRSYLPDAWWEKEKKRLLELLAREPFVYCVEHHPAGHTRRVQVQSIRQDSEQSWVWPPSRRNGPGWRARVYAIDYGEEYDVDAIYLYWLDKRFYEQPACTFRVKVVDSDRSLPIMQKVATFQPKVTTTQEREQLICAFTEYSSSIVASAEDQDENYEGFHCRFFVIPVPVKK